MSKIADDPALSYQTEILKKMSPAKKWAVASQLYWTAYNLKKAWVKKQHPDWSENLIQEEVKKAFMYART